MMCCNACPFHPITGSQEERCPRPVCRPRTAPCPDGECATHIRSRCHQDVFVLSRLYQGHPLARQLAGQTLETACQNRDRALLVALFHAAPDDLRGALWQSLGNHHPRCLWMLNPLFQAAGLPPVEHLHRLGSHSRQYREAVFANPYAGGLFQSEEPRRAATKRRLPLVEPPCGPTETGDQTLPA